MAGAGGYAGAELARILLSHPRFAQVLPVFFGRDSGHEGARVQTLSEVHPSLTRPAEIEVIPFSWNRVEELGVELLLLATPHEQSRAWVPKAMDRGIRVIDLSGAWRLKDRRNRTIYGFHDEDAHSSSKLQEEAVYGAPELHKDEIAAARIVANPGCYATSIILALAPLIAQGSIDTEVGVICDSKSGVSGAGKTPSPNTHFMHAADNLSAYSVFGHRHTGELLEQLHLSDSQIQFTPHLLPIPRGILSTIYLRLKQASSASDLLSRMSAFHSASPFVRVRKSGLLPQIQHVLRTNFCDLGLAVHEDGRRVVIVSCLDNLLKGAAGQAIQNLNLMCGWGEAEGLL